MEFQVPQFIEVENKIFGPLTVKQFVYLAGGAGICYVLYKLLPFFLGVPAVLTVGGLSLALAFYRLNNKPFAFILETALRYLIKEKLYTWRRTGHPRVKEKEKSAEQSAISLVPRVGRSKLSDLIWSLDVTHSGRKKLEK